jgi:hypothetical protein
MVEVGVGEVGVARSRRRGRMEEGGVPIVCIKSERNRRSGGEREEREERERGRRKGSRRRKGNEDGDGGGGALQVMRKSGGVLKVMSRGDGEGISTEWSGA